MRNAKEDDITDVFSRINTYGHRLSDQERDRRVFKTPLLISSGNSLYAKGRRISGNYAIENYAIHQY